MGYFGDLPRMFISVSMADRSRVSVGWEWWSCVMYVDVGGCEEDTSIAWNIYNTVHVPM